MPTVKLWLRSEAIVLGADASAAVIGDAVGDVVAEFETAGAACA